jgi:hypothetical protein
MRNSGVVIHVGIRAPGAVVDTDATEDFRNVLVTREQWS